MAGGINGYDSYSDYYAEQARKRAEEERKRLEEERRKAEEEKKAQEAKEAQEAQEAKETQEAKEAEAAREAEEVQELYLDEASIWDDGVDAVSSADMPAVYIDILDEEWEYVLTAEGSQAVMSINGPNQTEGIYDTETAKAASEVITSIAKTLFPDKTDWTNEEIVQAATINLLTNIVDSNAAMLSSPDSYGWTGSLRNSIVELFGIDVSYEDIQNVINSQQQGIELLKKSITGELTQQDIYDYSKSKLSADPNYSFIEDAIDYLPYDIVVDWATNGIPEDKHIYLTTRTSDGFGSYEVGIEPPPYMMTDVIGITIYDDDSEVVYQQGNVACEPAEYTVDETNTIHYNDTLESYKLDEVSAQTKVDFQTAYKITQGKEYSEQNVAQYLDSAQAVEYLSEVLAGVNGLTQNIFDSSNMQGVIDSFISYYGNEEIALEELNQYLYDTIHPSRENFSSDEEYEQALSALESSISSGYGNKMTDFRIIKNDDGTYSVSRTYEDGTQYIDKASELNNPLNVYPSLCNSNYFYNIYDSYLRSTTGAGIEDYANEYQQAYLNLTLPGSETYSLIENYDKGEKNAVNVAARIGTTATVILALALAAESGGTSLSLLGGAATGTSMSFGTSLAVATIAGGTANTFIRGTNAKSAGKDYSFGEYAKDFASGGVSGAVIPLSMGIGRLAYTAYGLGTSALIYQSSLSGGLLSRLACSPIGASALRVMVRTAAIQTAGEFTGTIEGANQYLSYSENPTLTGLYYAARDGRNYAGQVAGITGLASSVLLEIPGLISIYSAPIYTSPDGYLPSGSNPTAATDSTGLITQPDSQLSIPAPSGYSYAVPEPGLIGTVSGGYALPQADGVIPASASAGMTPSVPMTSAADISQAMSRLEQELFRPVGLVQQNDSTSCPIAAVLNGIEKNSALAQAVLNSFRPNTDGTYTVEMFGNEYTFSLDGQTNPLQKVYDMYQAEHLNSPSPEKVTDVLSQMFPNSDVVLVTPNAESVPQLAPYMNDELSVLTFNTNQAIEGIIPGHAYTVMNIASDGTITLKDPLNPQGSITLSPEQYYGQSQIAGMTLGENGGLTDGTVENAVSGDSLAVQFTKKAYIAPVNSAWAADTGFAEYCSRQPNISTADIAGLHKLYVDTNVAMPQLENTLAGKLNYNQNMTREMVFDVVANLIDNQSNVPGIPISQQLETLLDKYQICAKDGNLTFSDYFNDRANFDRRAANVKTTSLTTTTTSNPVSVHLPKSIAGASPATPTIAITGELMKNGVLVDQMLAANPNLAQKLGAMDKATLQKLYPMRNMTQKQYDRYIESKLAAVKGYLAGNISENSHDFYEIIGKIHSAQQMGNPRGSNVFVNNFPSLQNAFAGIYNGDPAIQTEVNQIAGYVNAMITQSGGALNEHSATRALFRDKTVLMVNANQVDANGNLMTNTDGEPITVPLSIGFSDMTKILQKVHTKAPITSDKTFNVKCGGNSYQWTIKPMGGNKYTLVFGNIEIVYTTNGSSTLTSIWEDEIQRYISN